MMHGTNLQDVKQDGLLGVEPRELWKAAVVGDSQGQAKEKDDLKGREGSWPVHAAMSFAGIFMSSHMELYEYIL